MTAFGEKESLKYVTRATQPRITLSHTSCTECLGGIAKI
mgnify:CR=1 FL=1